MCLSAGLRVGPSPGAVRTGRGQAPRNGSEPHGLCFAVYAAFPGSSRPQLPGSAVTHPGTEAQTHTTAQTRSSAKRCCQQCSVQPRPHYTGPGGLPVPSLGQGWLQLAKKSWPGCKTPGDDTAPSFKHPASPWALLTHLLALPVPTSL